MHVALFTDLHPDGLGGTQVSVATQRRALEECGHLVTVFTAPMPGSVDPDPSVVELRPVPVVDPLMRKLGRHEDFVLVWPSKANRAIIDEAFSSRGPTNDERIKPDVAVLAISGFDEREAKQRFGEGISGFVQKPFTPSQLGAKIAAAKRAG